MATQAGCGLVGSMELGSRRRLSSRQDKKRPSPQFPAQIDSWRALTPS